MVDKIQKCKDEIVTRKRIQLGTFISEYSVRNKNDLNIPVYSVTNSQGFCKEYFGKEIASKDKTTYKIVPYGYLHIILLESMLVQLIGRDVRNR